MSSSLWSRDTIALLDERLARLAKACRDAGVPFQDDAGVDVHLQRVLLASDFALESLLADPQLLGVDFLPLMIDPRHADARAGSLFDDMATPALRRALRRFRLREALRLIWRDVNDIDPIETTLAGASSLAESCLQAALRGAEREVAERHGVVRDSEGDMQRLVVLALGKLGGGELNFSSDIDLVFTYAEHGESDGARPLDAGTYFARVGQSLVSLLADRDADGYVYRVDMRLRPFGGAGRLALSFAAMEQYFQREGRDWERYAWIKARAVAGDLAAGARLLDGLRPFVFRRYLDYGAFAGLREMKALIDAEVARKDLADHVKLGSGGIREIEFIVQLVQLIRGGREPALRARGLLSALAAAEQLGYMPATRARRLREAYRFLRRLENRLQMLADQQTHEVPHDPVLRDRIALALDYADWPSLAVDLQAQRAAVAEEFAALMAVDERHQARQVQVEWQAFWRGLALSEEIDTQPLIQAGFDPPQQIVEELQSLLASSALRHMSARARERLDRVMPARFAIAAQQAEPRACLLRLLRLVRAVARRSVYLALLDEQPLALKRLTEVFSASTFLAERIIAHPLLLDDLFDRRVDSDPPEAQAIESKLQRRLAALGNSDPETEVELIQEQRQSALFRIGLGFLSGRLDAVATARALSDVAGIVVNAVLRIAEREIVATHGRLQGQGGEGSGLAVLAYGSFGGAELGFGSDLDLVFLYDDSVGHAESDGARPLEAPRYYARLAQRIVHLLGMPTRAGRLYEVDVRLRPDGRTGMLVLTTSVWETYQRERAWIWELQALVRARVVAGSVALARSIDTIRRSVLRLQRDANAVPAEIVAMRERWRAERDRSNAEQFDLKQGLGGLVDVEFLLQALALLHGDRYADLLHSGNSHELIAVVGESGLLAGDLAAGLAQAHAGLLARAIGCTLDGRPRVTARDAELNGWVAQVLAAATAAGLRFGAPLTPDAPT